MARERTGTVGMKSDTWRLSIELGKMKYEKKIVKNRRFNDDEIIWPYRIALFESK